MALTYEDAVALLKDLADEARWTAHGEVAGSEAERRHLRHEEALSMALERMKAGPPPTPALTRRAELMELGRSLHQKYPHILRVDSPEEQAAWLLYRTGGDVRRTMADCSLRLPGREAIGATGRAETGWEALDGMLILRVLISALE